jgi:hypothetical protein
LRPRTSVDLTCIADSLNLFIKSSVSSFFFDFFVVTIGLFFFVLTSLAFKASKSIAPTPIVFVGVRQKDFGVVSQGSNRIVPVRLVCYSQYGLVEERQQVLTTRINEAQEICSPGFDNDSAPTDVVV